MPSVPVDFMPGVELSRRLHDDAVRPLFSRHLPDLTYSAALIGTGSEVLGFDTRRSTDHDWGPRLHLFLTADDLARHGARVDHLLGERLPATIAGYPTSLVRTGHGTRHLRHTTGPVQHGVVIAEFGDWLTGHLGFDPLSGVTPEDWLATPTQTLAEVTAGAVHHDGLGVLAAARRALAWYPDDVWRYVLACQWQRVSQEEPFVGRCGEVGDELGSAVVAARLVRDLMRLRLLIERTYPPYSKWLGTAFARLPDTDQLAATLAAALGADNWRDRERHLVTAYETTAARHNDLGLTAPVDPRTRHFHGRPFRVLHAERFARALIDAIGDPALRALPLTGAIDQFVDSTDVLGHRTRSRKLTAALYPPDR
ncbi:DUF4037 domain-containing protein [Micromonospora sp. WMMD1128]|uniref:DUF4037 domain-containing protein n=1 Tax=Micromonospora sp. WMMD1128 TaxID=3015150 RepID=UPI00248B9C80|nr:DUF4037 domain-containing protein [Micromonospora sp. WMMD1128]WBB76056.1 DUF4037 domain-containing protein [Micromonospora sp. WMMD1128]